MHRAGAALPVITTFLGSGKRHSFAVQSSNVVRGFDLQFVVFAIDAQGDRTAPATAETSSFREGHYRGRRLSGHMRG